MSSPPPSSASSHLPLRVPPSRPSSDQVARQTKPSSLSPPTKTSPSPPTPTSALNPRPSPPLKRPGSPSTPTSRSPLVTSSPPPLPRPAMPPTSMPPLPPTSMASLAMALGYPAASPYAAYSPYGLPPSLHHP